MYPKKTLPISEVLSTLNAYIVINGSKLEENANSRSLQVENEAMYKLCGISCTQ